MKIICIGRNYTEHIKELNNETPEEPVIFIKPDTALLRNNNPFFIPDFSNDVHHEVEVVVKIKKPGRYIPVGFAKDYYDEVALGIDFTARDIQSQLKAKGLPWEKAKGFDHSAAISAFIPLNKLTNEGSEGIYAATFSLEKNGMVVQSGNTNQMIHNVDEIIAHVSEYFSLRIGDYIYTGTPAGVGAVKSGDQLKGFLAGKEMFNFVVK
jgi:2-keto-4-pentenoate hydratase/2-oxohepta-3-ene-1,7-dioic acid hydratase in catechol pathway